MSMLCDGSPITTAGWGVPLVQAKRSIEIEKLLQWAYIDELSKRQTSSAEGLWDRLKQNGSLGGVDPDPGHGSAQRYPHFGTPHPDARKIEEAVGALTDLVIDWNASHEAIFGEDLSGLVSINHGVFGRQEKPGKVTRVGWYNRAARSRWESQEIRPRDVLIVGRLNTAALVTMHAKAKTRPDWREDIPRPRPIIATNSSKPSIVGECRAKDAYTLGSYCPLRWEPSPITIAQSRADYACWHRGLAILAETLDLEQHVALRPSAPALPWAGEREPQRHVYAVGERPQHERKLPLKPKRRAPLPQKRRQNSEVRKIPA